MKWHEDVSGRYASMGWEALRPARDAFGKRLEQFLSEQGLVVVDDNPEGHDWLLLLKDGTELYVERRSYDTTDPEATFWIEYSPQDGGVIAEFYDKSGKPSERFVIVPNEQIADAKDDW